MAYQVKGYIRRTDNSKGIKGLTVKAWDVDLWPNPDDLLGEAVTDKNGYYTINFTKDAFGGGWEPGWAPDIVVKVFDRWGNEIKKSDKIQDASTTTNVDILVKPELIGDFTVKGRILLTDTGQGISGLSVKARDIDIALHDALGEAVTDKSGYYTINFTKDAFGGGGEVHPDIQIKVLDRWGGVIHTSDTYWNVGVSKTVDDIKISPELLGDFTVKGRILLTDTDLGIGGLKVEASDIDIALHDALGEAVTDKSGYYTINFTKDAFGGGGEVHPDIEIKVFNTLGVLIHTSDTKWGAGASETLPNIEITPELEEAMEICADQPTPDGWVVIEYRTHSKCGDGIYNVKVIQQYVDLQVGESIWVCSGTDCLTPDGWVVIEYKTSDKCGDGIDNMKLIQKIEVARSLPIRGSNVQITNILYDGLVPRVESDEYVEITNSGTEPQDLAGWVLKDISEGYPSFTFPQSVLKPRETIRVYTNEIHPLWGGFSFGYGRAIWNNKEPDTAALYNAQGEEIFRKSY